MIKVINMINTDSDENSYKVSLFSDTAEEVTSGAEILGFPENATIEMGSVCLTAYGDVAFMKSDGTWNWLESGGGGSTLISKTITENGTYDPHDDNADGYSEVTVEVESGGTVFYLDNDKIATSAGEYITANLLEELPANTLLLLSIKDGTKKINEVVSYTGGTKVFAVDGGAYEVTLTATTIGLSYYSGDWRNIYAKLSQLDPTQIY